MNMKPGIVDAQTKATIGSGGVGGSVNHPAHYNAHPSGVECIVIVEHYNFNVGNAIKYLWRAGLKSADALEDLRKSVWYVNREIERLEKANAAR